MNKKIMSLGLAALMLAACSGDSAKGTTETATVTTDSTEITATLTKDADGKLTGVEIDEYDEEQGISKKDAGEDYGMAKASGIGKEWDEQIEFLENYILENGVDSVKLDSKGYAESEDVLAGCTINLTNIMKAVDEANAK